jgi:uncharacterized protein YkwD
MLRPRRLALTCAAALLGALVAVGGTAATPKLGGSAVHSERLLAPTAACAGSDASDSTAADQLRQMACLVQYARTRAGLPALRESRILDRAAALKIAADLRCGTFTHTPCGQPFQNVFFAAGYPLGNSYSLGENLAYGQDELGTPQQIMAAWLASPDHRRNLLDPAWSTFGLGVRPGMTFLGLPGVAVWANEFAGS